MPSIKLILRSDKVNKNSGKAPLYLRIIKDRKTRFLSLGQQIEPKHWDDEKQRVKKSYPNSARMNAFLAQKVAEAEEKVLSESQKNRNISTKQLKASIIGKEPAKFFDFAYKKIEMISTNRKFSTYINYKQNLEKFEKFCGNKDVYFDDITTSLLKDFEHYLISERGNKAITASYCFKVLKLVFNQAIEEDIIPLSQNPLRKYQIKYALATKDFLDETHIQQLMEYEANHPTKKLVLDMFIFACFAGGLRFTDTLSLKWEHYNREEKRVFKIIEKTSRKHQIRLPQQAVDIIEKYHTETFKPTDYIFPYIPENKEYSKSEFFFMKNYLGKKANRHLQNIGNELQIPFKLSFHISRHTFATRALRKGMRIEYVSKILDHSSIRQTQVYAKIVNSELDNAMDNIFAE